MGLDIRCLPIKGKVSYGKAMFGISVKRESEDFSRCQTWKPFIDQKDLYLDLNSAQNLFLLPYFHARFSQDIIQLG